MFNEKPEVVTCEECRLLLNKNDAQQVTFIEFNSFLLQIPTFIYYCPKDKKPYNKIIKYPFNNINYYKEFLITEDGTPIGYKKIKK